MTKEFYIPRTLCDENKTYSETEMLASSRYIVVLAEPGGGKTKLLGSLAARLQTDRISASQFQYSSSTMERAALVLDAFDEVSKIDSSGMFQLFSKAQDTGAEKIVLSSRSSEWDTACTHRFKDFFGELPKIVRLTAFNVEEQKQLFKNHAPCEDFNQFCSEASRFNLEPLLPNPQFLQLFADAYIESGRHFSNKSSIFEKAIDRLAREVNPSVSQKGAIKLEKKIELASETFAKLLLSGSEGVASTDVSSNRLYPRLASLVNDNTPPDCILETRLFNPGDKADQHQPVHKIVAEYCAAQYLTNRIINSTDTLSLPQCIAIIAPNSTVRDELRGMLGWMAALGHEPIQMAALKLDPYAVLANGDPTRLLPSSKKHLIHRLKEVAEIDPLFRRGDNWRTFSGAGFFTEDVVDELKPLLRGSNEHGHLRGLLLELLIGSPAISLLVNELQWLVRSPKSSYDIRSLASNCLLDQKDHDHQVDASNLISEASETSLSIAANIIVGAGVKKFEETFILDFLRACECLYPRHDQCEWVIGLGKKYFIKEFISTLGFSAVEWLLNELTSGLSCKCRKKVVECYCRNGVSKIVGMLLDRYFELSDTFDPLLIWQ